MSASAARRRLCATILLPVASVVASALLAAPSATAASQPSSAVSPGQSVNGDTLAPIAQRINRAANIAVAQIGDPYVYGAEGPGAFDCSGLSMYSYGHASLSLPRTSAAQYNAVRHILKKNMIRGDLVFFHDSSGRIYHLGIFLYWNADHRAVIVHAPYPGQRVHRAPVWTTSWWAGTRRP